MLSKRRVVISAAVLLVLLVAALSITRYAQAGAYNQASKLYGSWHMDIYVPEADMHVGGLTTFFADGSIISDETPAGEVTQHGNWVMGSRGEVKATIWGLIESPEGTYAGKYKVVFTLQRDNKTDTWSGPFVLTNYDSFDGAIATGILTYTRIAVEELP